MKIEQLPSGSYRVRQQIEGHRYSLIFGHKPSQREINAELSKQITNTPKIGKFMLLEQACEEYLKIKSNVLSPSTITGYQKYYRLLPHNLLQKNIYEITNVDLQIFVNTFSATHSPKYTRNVFGFISAVLNTFYPSLNISITLPQKTPNEPYLPTKSDIAKILKEVQGTEFELPYKLAILGLRRSEICALSYSDLTGNILHINKAKVQNASREWVIKPMAKTETSVRDVYVPNDIVELLKSKGNAYTGYPGTLTVHLKRCQAKLNIPVFSLHKFRHYFASEMSTITDEATVMAMGGWKTDYVMKNVYRHATKEQLLNAQKASVEKLIGSTWDS